MNVFVVGGVTVSDKDPGFAQESQCLLDSMKIVGREIVRANHKLLVCSPFGNSADVAAVRGAMEGGAKRAEKSVHFYIPEAAKVREALAKLKADLPELNCEVFPSKGPGMETDEGRLHAWLLAQFCALDRCNVLIAIGGKLVGPMSLLLPVAESRRYEILPFCFLGGAAAQCFDRRRYQLEDKLGEEIGALADPTRCGEVVSLLGRLSLDRPPAHKSAPVTFFVSYAQARPNEADLVETILRRRKLEVFRDEPNFGAGRRVLSEIEGYIDRADVFIVLWCREYACSPWCFDELDQALKRRAKGRLSVWLFILDDTRIVPPGARELLNYPVKSRKELEGELIKLVDQLSSRPTG